MKTSLARYSFYEVVGKDSFQLVKLEGLPVEDITDIYSSEYGLLCDTWGGTLYQYSIDSSGWKMLLQWGDADMYHPVSNTNLIAQISEDRIITYLAVDTGRENREGNLSLGGIGYKTEQPSGVFKSAGFVRCEPVRCFELCRKTDI